MTTRNGRHAHGDQLELTPRIGLSEPLLGPEDAAELLSARVSCIYEPCRAGRLPFLRVGKHLRFTRSELDSTLDLLHGNAYNNSWIRVISREFARYSSS